MPNIKEVARLAGVSTSTVSRALSGRVAVSPRTRERVLRAVGELDYQPNALAQGLKEGRSRTIGLIVPNIHHLAFPPAVRGVTDAAGKHGYTVVLCNTDEDRGTELSHIRNLARRFVDGLIFSTATEESSHITALRDSGCPVVLMLRHLGESVDAVIVDSFEGARRATGLLLQKGYRRIGLINGTLSLDLYRQRLAGYRAALEEAGVDYNESLVRNGADGWRDGYAAAREMLAAGVKPDAFFGTSDPKALGVLKALRESGLRVPEDVALMGYDDLEMAELADPPLATVAQPFYEVGFKAAERLFKLISAKRRPKPVVEKLMPKLVLRQSVGSRRQTEKDQ